MIENCFAYISRDTDPYYNIALEKALLEQVPPRSCILYLWQNQNTVVIGRNQNAWLECRTSLLESEGGHLARRLSGGGAVFHDLGNLNFTFLVNDGDYDVDRQLSVIQVACKGLGIESEKSGRNDLLAQGQKFSGNAFFHKGGKAYHHGTLLVNADMDKLGRYLTPPKAKLEAKGISSVRSRVTNLSALCPGLTCGSLQQALQEAFSQVYGRPVLPFSPDLTSLEKDAEQFGSWEWLYGPRLPFGFACEGRFSWGSIRLQLQVESGKITRCDVFTDAMDWHLPETVSGLLTGCRFTLEDMTRVLASQPDIITLLKEQAL